jgi:type II restriction/modification system DNA methylase subunit YeeA
MATITVQKFIQKWQASKLKESAAAQSHFNDLCDLLGHETPTQADPEGEWFTFEYGAQKTTGSQGFADVWKKGFFGWEYKGKHKDLTVAYAQLQQYAPALANPPLLIVCDTEKFIIHTNWNDYVSEKHEILLEELANVDKLNLLRYAFFEPEKLKPRKSRQQLTEEVAGQFATISEKLRKRGNDPQEVAHFVNRLIFCMFAEDIKLLPNKIFEELLSRGIKSPNDFQRKLSSLFVAMRDGSAWGADDILWFNGGLFDTDATLKLEPIEIKMIYDVALKDWSDIDPSIMGTLFERGLDPSKRSELGAHYTDRDKIMKIITPVIIEPLEQEWQEVENKIKEELAAAEKLDPKKSTKDAGQYTKLNKQAKKRFHAFKDKLMGYKVLDPACGSGNFLYLSLKALKDIEHKANIQGQALLGLSHAIPEIGPQNVYGVEINPYAAELARVSVWIGEIQWIKRHGFNVPANPVLKKLDNIKCHDALINEDGSEYHWPKVNVVIGNPPFIGDKKMIRELGEEYTVKLRKTYEGRVAGGADLVCYWFAKCNDYMKAGWLERAGLVSTNSIRGGKNRKVLDAICEKFQIYNAWADESWFNAGAAVRVSMTCFSREKIKGAALDGNIVSGIFSDLTEESKAANLDASKVEKLRENIAISFIGTQKNGPFNVSGEIARGWLQLPTNPNGRPNSDVIFPWVNGMDLTRRYSDTWVVDFGTGMPLNEAALYEVPYSHVEKHVKPTRENLRRANHREKWWLYGETRPALRKEIKKLNRYICTPRVSKYRLFKWLDKRVMPDSATAIIAKEDDFTFGILSGRYHTLWSLKLGTELEDRPRYTPSTTFETFPFPKGMEPNKISSVVLKNPKASKIAEAAKKLNELRENWLNPSDIVKRVPEVVAGYPDRVVLKNKSSENVLKKRTLTNLYNEMPTWLKNAHKELDDAIAAAYGWPADLSDEEILERLFALNQQRAK